MEAVGHAFLDSLPQELIAHILYNVDAYDIVNLSMSSKKFGSIWKLVRKCYLPYVASPKIGLLFNKPFYALEDFEIRYEEYYVRPVTFDCFNGCNNLTRMWVSNRLPIEQPIKIISNITSLQSLTLENLNVFQDTLDFSKHLTQHTRLTSLSVQSATIENIYNTYYMTRLRSLSLNCPRLEIDPIDTLTPLTNLTHLAFYYTHSNFFGALTQLIGLISLDVTKPFVKRSPQKAHMDELEKSLIHDARGRNMDSYKRIAGLATLRCFSVNYYYPLYTLPNLEKLEIGAEIYEELTALSKLVDLTAHDTYITQNALNVFNATQLTRLAIKACEWNSIDSATFFGEFSKLSKLELFEYDSELRVSNPESDLVQNLQKITTLRALTMPIEHLIDSMTQLTQLHSVNLISDSRKKFSECTRKKWPFDLSFVMKKQVQPSKSPYEV